MAACAAGLFSSGAHAQTGCDIDEAQRLFGQQPRPVETVERLLVDCQKAGSTDYRVYMFLGVMARDAGNRERAIEFLKKAHEMAPAEPNPALELAFTLEAGHAAEAGDLYGQILKRDPRSRPAMLGLARVARSRNRLHDARARTWRPKAVQSHGSSSRALDPAAAFRAAMAREECHAERYARAQRFSSCEAGCRPPARPAEPWPRAGTKQARRIGRPNTTNQTKQ